MADQNNPYGDRRPSFNLHGQQRGFRSRPGAPMADATRNVGATYGPLLKGLTPASNWESMFHNFVTGGNTATGVGATPPSAAGSMSAQAQQGMGQQLDQLPSLATIAGGGVTPHQERWAQAQVPSPGVGTPNPLAGTGFETGNPTDILNKYQTPGTTAMTNYGWNTAFQNPQQQDEED